MILKIKSLEQKRIVEKLSNQFISMGKKTRKKKNVKKYKKSRKRRKTIYSKTKGGKFSKKMRKKSNGKKIKYIKENCAPKNKEETLPYTCYTVKGLHKIKNIWNKKHPDNKITSNDPKKIWNNLRYAFNNTCDKESCWLKHKCIKEDIDLETKEYTFTPSAPKEWKKKPNEWLTSIDILEVMKQYEKTYKCFEFLGPSPIDYDTHKMYGECVWEELCEFNLGKAIKNGKKKIGIIFNLDKHTQPGSHWVALFINTKKNKIYYMDSYGEDIPKKINEFSEKVIKQAVSQKLGNYELIESDIRHQYGDSECGMYSLYFIIKMLKGMSFKTFTKTRIKDSEMKKMRKKWFN